MVLLVSNGHWEDYSFGNLDQFAETRKEVLEAVLPRLDIREAARIDGKFLIVRGSLNTYKVHLGSSNVLKMPGGRYLCIVPKGKSVAANITLLFEGDQQLSVILSKGMMLADDTKVTDPVIVQQFSQ